MGTRNLTTVIHNGDTRMAQYGQWDGYPSGVGKDIAEVIQATPIAQLRRAMEKTVFIDQKKLKKYYTDAGADPKSDWVTMDVSDKFKAAHPLLHRDYSGGKALVEILRQAKKKRSHVLLPIQIELLDERNYTDGAWNYVIDLDNETVSVQKWGQEEPFVFKFENFTPNLMKHFETRGPLEWTPED